MLVKEQPGNVCSAFIGFICHSLVCKRYETLKETDQKASSVFKPV